MSDGDVDRCDVWLSGERCVYIKRHGGEHWFATIGHVADVVAQQRISELESRVGELIERALAAEQERDKYVDGFRHEQHIACEYQRLYAEACNERDASKAALADRDQQIATWLKQEADQHGPFLDGYVLATDIRSGAWRPK